MIIVAGSFMLDPQDRDAFLRGRDDAMRRSRGEAGCIDYVFSADPLDDRRVVLFERWEDKASLAAHLAAMRGSAGQASGAPAVKVLSSEIAQFEISATGPVGS